MAVVRYREENGKISRKYGNGADFAPDCPGHAKLSDVLANLAEMSLSRLIRDHEAGKLQQFCRG
jgi:hypothetical protein